MPSIDTEREFEKVQGPKRTLISKGHGEYLSKIFL